MASEMGVLPIPEKDIVNKWRLQPGKMLLVDLEEGRLIPDEEIEGDARQEPSLQGVAATARRSCWKSCRPRRREPRCRTCRCSIASRRSATRRKT